MIISKKQALDYLKTLYNGTGQSKVDETMYNQILAYIENTSDIVKSKEFLEMESRCYVAEHLSKLYRLRINNALAALEGEDYENNKR